LAERFGYYPIHDQHYIKQFVTNPRQYDFYSLQPHLASIFAAYCLHLFPVFIKNGANEELLGQDLLGFAIKAQCQSLDVLQNPSLPTIQYLLDMGIQFSSDLVQRTLDLFVSPGFVHLPEDGILDTPLRSSHPLAMIHRHCKMNVDHLIEKAIRKVIYASPYNSYIPVEILLNSFYSQYPELTKSILLSIFSDMKSLHTFCLGEEGNYPGELTVDIPNPSFDEESSEIELSHSSTPAIPLPSRRGPPTSSSSTSMSTSHHSMCISPPHSSSSPSLTSSFLSSLSLSPPSMTSCKYSNHLNYQSNEESPAIYTYHTILNSPPQHFYPSKLFYHIYGFDHSLSQTIFTDLLGIGSALNHFRYDGHGPTKSNQSNDFIRKRNNFLLELIEAGFPVLPKHLLLLQDCDKHPVVIAILKQAQSHYWKRHDCWVPVIHESLQLHKANARRRHSNMQYGHQYYASSGQSTNGSISGTGGNRHQRSHSGSHGNNLISGHARSHSGGSHVGSWGSISGSSFIHHVESWGHMSINTTDITLDSNIIINSDNDTQLGHRSIGNWGTTTSNCGINTHHHHNHHNNHHHQHHHHHHQYYYHQHSHHSHHHHKRKYKGFFTGKVLELITKPDGYGVWIDNVNDEGCVHMKSNSSLSIHESNDAFFSQRVK